MAHDDGIDCAAGLLCGRSFARDVVFATVFAEMIIIVMAAPDLFSAPNRV